MHWCSTVRFDTWVIGITDCLGSLNAAGCGTKPIHVFPRVHRLQQALWKLLGELREMLHLQGRRLSVMCAHEVYHQRVLPQTAANKLTCLSAPSCSLSSSASMAVTRSGHSGWLGKRWCGAARRQ